MKGSPMGLSDRTAYTADNIHFVPTYVHGPLHALARPAREIVAAPLHTWTAGYLADLHASPSRFSTHGPRSTP